MCKHISTIQPPATLAKIAAFAEKDHAARVEFQRRVRSELLASSGVISRDRKPRK